MVVQLSLVASIKDMNGTLRMSSRDIARARGKLHKNVLRVIDNLLSLYPDLNGLNFEPVDYVDAKGEVRREYLCDEKGAILVAVNLGGKGAIDFQCKLIDAFQAMRSQLQKLGALPLVTTDPLALLELATDTIRKERTLRIAAEERADKAETIAEEASYIVIADAWRFVDGFSEVRAHTKYQLAGLLKRICDRMQMTWREVPRQAPNGKVYTYHAYPRAVWDEYVRLYASARCATEVCAQRS